MLQQISIFPDATALDGSSHSALLFLSLSTSLGFPAEPDEKQKEIQNNTISEGKHPVVTVFTTTYLPLIVCCLCSVVKYVGGYHGLLSGVTVRPGSVEPHSVVECLYACREGLDFGDLETLGSGMKVKKGPNTELSNKFFEVWMFSDIPAFPTWFIQVFNEEKVAFTFF